MPTIKTPIPATLVDELEKQLPDRSFSRPSDSLSELNWYNAQRELVRWIRRQYTIQQEADQRVLEQA